MKGGDGVCAAEVILDGPDVADDGDAGDLKPFTQDASGGECEDEMQETYSR